MEQAWKASLHHQHSSPHDNIEGKQQKEALKEGEKDRGSPNHSQDDLERKKGVVFLLHSAGGGNERLGWNKGEKKKGRKKERRGKTERKREICYVH